MRRARSSLRDRTERTVLRPRCQEVYEAERRYLIQVWRTDRWRCMLRR